jgi:hypothetical protein
LKGSPPQTKLPGNLAPGNQQRNAWVNGSLGYRVTVEFTFPPYKRSGNHQVHAGRPLLPNNLISDLEKAIANRSEETGAMLHRITDLFLLNVGHYSADQLEVYDGILHMLVAKVEVAARAKLAQRLAPVGAAPAKTIRTLALDGAIEVAEPVLSQSTALDDDTLMQCIAINGQDHLLAIATRAKVSESVSDQLLSKGNNKVLGTLASNPGAQISGNGFSKLVEKSADDDWLSECVGARKDVPEHHLRMLLLKASGIVRQRLISVNPDLRDLIDEILPEAAAPAADKSRRRSKDYRTAELAVKAQPLTEEVVKEYAKQLKVEEVIVSIAQLSGLSTDEIERLFMGAWTSPVAVILKAVGFHLATVEAIYRSRLASGEVPRNDLIQVKAEFIALRRPTAERIMRFFCARKAANISNLSVGALRN